IASGSSVTTTVTYTVPSSTPAGQQVNSVSVTSTTSDPNTSNNTATDTDTVATSANLAITKSGPSTATAGDPAGFDYTTPVHNAGPSDNASPGFHVTDTLPAGLTFASGAGCSAVGQVVTCSAASLAAGADKVFTVHVTLASTVNSNTVLSNSATVASDGT